MKWPTIKLGEVCDFKVAKNAKDLPYVGMEDVESHTGKFVGSREPRKVRSATNYFDESSVLYGKLRPYLNKVLIPDFKGHCTTEFVPLRPDPKVLSREWLAFWLSSADIVAEMSEHTTGSRMPRADMKHLAELEIPLPPLSEQKKIVKVLEEKLGKVKEAIKLREDALADTEKILPARLAEIFAEGKNQEWEENELGDICEIKHGHAFKSQYFTSLGNYVLLTPGNFFEEGGYRDRGDKQKYYKGPIPKGFILDKGNLLIAMTEQAAGLLGSPIFVPKSNKFLHNQRLGLVALKSPKKVNLKFLYHFFNLKKTRDLIQETAAGTKVKHTSPKKIYKIKIQFPNLKTQEKIVKELDALSTRVEELRALQQDQLHDIKSLEHAYLHEAFNGELV